MSEKIECSKCKKQIHVDDFVPLPGFERVCDNCFRDMDYDEMFSRLSSIAAPITIDEDFKLMNDLINNDCFQLDIQVNAIFIYARLSSRDIDKTELESLINSFTHEYTIMEAKEDRSKYIRFRRKKNAQDIFYNNK